MKINAKPPRPSKSAMDAPGQCKVLKSVPNIVKLENNAPEINAIFFILSVFFKH